nr:hypothetical protein [Planctomycetota bacterium]
AFDLQELNVVRQIDRRARQVSVVERGESCILVAMEFAATVRCDRALACKVRLANPGNRP